MLQHLTGHGSLPMCGTCHQSQLASFSQAGCSSRKRCDYAFVVSAVSTTNGSRLLRSGGGGEDWGGGGGGGAWIACVYACTHNYCGLGHATWSTTVPVSRSQTPSFQHNRHFTFSTACFAKAVGIAHKLHRCLQCENRDRQTDTLTHTTTVTLAAHARRGLIVI